MTLLIISIIILIFLNIGVYVYNKQFPNYKQTDKYLRSSQAVASLSTFQLDNWFKRSTQTPEKFTSYMDAPLTKNNKTSESNIPNKLVDAVNLMFPIHKNDSEKNISTYKSNTAMFEKNMEGVRAPTRINTNRHTAKPSELIPNVHRDGYHDR